MGFFDDLITVSPQAQVERLKLQEYKRKLAEEDAVRNAGVNLLSGYRSPDEIGATPELRQGNLLSAAVDRSADTSPDGKTRNVTVGGNLFGYDSVPDDKLYGAAFPETAAARTRERAFPTPIDPDKRFKTGSDGSVWDFSPTGGGPPKRYDGTPSLDDYGKSLEASGIKRGTADFNDAMGKHRDKLDYIPGQDPLDIDIKKANLEKTRAETEAARIKAAGQNHYSAMPEGVIGPDAYDWVEKNTTDGKQIAAIARKVASGDIRMPTAGRPGSMGEKVMGLVSIAEPGVDMGQRFRTAQEYSQAGATGKAMRAVDTTLMHTDKLLNNFDKMRNSDLPMWNTVANAAEEAAGGGDPGAFDVSRDAVASEARKVFAGASGGGLQELTEWKGNLKRNASPEQMQKSATTLRDLLAGRLEPLVSDYNKTMGTDKSVRDFMSPKSRAIWDKLEAVATNGIAIPPPSKRVKGEKYRTPKGTMEWTGTGWLPVKS